MQAEVNHPDQPWALRIMPYLDGEPVHHAFFADDEAGVVRCFDSRWFPESGRRMIYLDRSPSGERMPKEIERRGKVELKRRPDTDHPAVAHLPIGDPGEWSAHYKVWAKTFPDA